MSFDCLLTITHHTNDPSTFESCELKTFAKKDLQGNQLTSSVILSWTKVCRSPFFYIFLRIEHIFMNLKFALKIKLFPHKFSNILYSENLYKLLDIGIHHKKNYD